MDVMTIITAVAFPVAAGAIGLAGRWILSGQKDIKEDIQNMQSGLDRRVTNLEADNRTFMSKTDLQKEFDHEAAGRKTIKDAAEYLIRKNADDIVLVKCDIARLDQSDKHLTTQFDALRHEVEKGFDRTGNKLEELSKCLTLIEKKLP